MDNRNNPFMKKSMEIANSNKPCNSRWAQIKEEVDEIENNNRIESEEQNKFKNFNNQRNQYSKFMRFTHKKEEKEEKKPEFNLEKMECDFPQLGKK